MQILRFANATVRTGLAAVVALSVFGTLTPVARADANDEDPWYFEILSEANQDGVSVTRVAPETEKTFGPNDPRRVEVDPGFVTAGTSYTVRLRAFKSNEVVRLRTYRFVSDCPDDRCWEWLSTDDVTVDARGNADKRINSSSKEPTDYRYCTTSTESCLKGYAELTVSPGAVTDPTLRQDRDACITGYVWREAFDGDHVCVTPASRRRAALDNSLADDHRKPGGGIWGPNTCRQGFVWRLASLSDRVCVKPSTRTQSLIENRQAASRRVRG